LRGIRQFPAELLAIGEQLPGEGADRSVGQRFWRDGAMVDAGRFDLVFRPCRRSVEDAAGNLFGFVKRMLLRERLRNVDRQEFWLASARGGRGDGVLGDLAVERTHGHVRVYGG